MGAAKRPKGALERSFDDNRHRGLPASGIAPALYRGSARAMKRDALSTCGAQLNDSPLPNWKNGIAAAGGAMMPSAIAAPARTTALPSSGFIDGAANVPVT